MSETATTTEDREPKTIFPVSSAPKTYDDQVMLNRLKLLYDQAKAYRKPVIGQWRRNFNILRNKTWGSTRPDWLPSPEVAEIYPRIASRVGWMTDQRPELQVVPAIQPNSPLYDFYSGIGNDLQTTLQAIWQVYNFNAEIEQVLWDGDIYGVGFLKTTWDDTLDNGLGNPVMKRVDPFTMYIDPQATSFDTANYIIEARNISLQELDRRFPGAFMRLKDSAYSESVDEQPTQFSNNGGQPPRANPGPISPNTTNMYGFPGQSGRFQIGAGDVTDRGVTLYECWLREHETNDLDGDGDVDVTDGWRVIVFASASAGGFILLDELAEDIYGTSRHPYSRYAPINTGEFYGMSLVETLIPSQLAVNRLLTALQMNVEFTGNPIMIESARAQLSRTKVSSRPGQRLLNKDPDPNAIHWMEPPDVNPMFMSLIEFHLEQMDFICGNSSMMKGDPPPGRASTDTIDTIAEAGFVRVRVSLRELEFALREQGQLQAELITQFYDAPRLVSAVGPTGQNTSIALKSNHFYVAPQSKQSEEREPMKFNLLINIGSENATSAQARRQDAAMLFAMGAIDGQAVLEAFNFPNRDAVTQRIQMAQAAGIQTQPGARQRAQRKS